MSLDYSNNVVFENVSHNEDIEIKGIFENDNIEKPPSYFGVYYGEGKIEYETKGTDALDQDNFLKEISKLFPRIIFRFVSNDSEEPNRIFETWICNGEEGSEQNAKRNQCNAINNEIERAITAKKDAAKGVMHQVMIMPDGHIIVAGENKFGECNACYWSNIEAISCGNWHTVGLCTDGKIVACGSNANGQCDVKKIKEKVCAISCGRYHTAALLSSGKVEILGRTSQKAVNDMFYKDKKYFVANFPIIENLKIDDDPKEMDKINEQIEKISVGDELFLKYNNGSVIDVLTKNGDRVGYIYEMQNIDMSTFISLNKLRATVDDVVPLSKRGKNTKKAAMKILISYVNTEEPKNDAKAVGNYKQTKVSLWPPVKKIMSIFDAVIGVTQSGEIYIDGYCPCSENDIKKYIGLLPNNDEKKETSIGMLLDSENHTSILDNEQEKTFKEQTLAEIKKEWRFVKQNDETLCITDYNGTDVDVIVPSKIGKGRVTSIAEYAFSVKKTKRQQNRITYLRNEFRSVVLPDGITDIGEHAFDGCTSLESIVVPESVTNIGACAFTSCSRLTSITIPEFITKIEEGTFSGCSNLMSITIPESVTSIGAWTFSNCSSLMSITIPESVTSIGDGAFRNTPLLNLQGESIIIHNFFICYKGNDTNYEIPECVTNICGYAFEGCRGLENIKIPESVICIGSCAFMDCCNLRSITIPNSVESIGDRAFWNCHSLGSASLSESITSILEYLFYNCGSLININIPESVTSIGEHAFNGCWRLNSITIPKFVTSIGRCAFNGCRKLKNVTISESVTSIGNSAFEGCIDLEDIVIPNSVTSIGTWTFSGCCCLECINIPNSVTSIGYEAFKLCSRLLSITIPESVTSIDDGAFEGCRSLKSITIPESVTSIGKSAFKDCANLENITTPESVTSIRYEAFKGCSSLTSITIPASVTSIGTWAFLGCSSLVSITIPKSVTSVGKNAFKDCTNLTSITIPESVTGIDDNVFKGCYKISNVVAPESLRNTLEKLIYHKGNINSNTVKTDVREYDTVESIDIMCASYDFGRYIFALMLGYSKSIRNIMWTKIPGRICVYLGIKKTTIQKRFYFCMVVIFLGFQFRVHLNVDFYEITF